jgi:hypothetical protein
MLPPPCYTVGRGPGILQLCHLAFRQRVQSWFDQKILFLMVWESLSFANSKKAVMCLLLRSGHSTTKAWLVKCCKDGCPSGRYSHFHRGTLELCQSDHWVLGHLPDQGTSPSIAQFGQASISRKSLGSSKLFPFKTDGGHFVLGGLQWSSMDNSFNLMAWLGAYIGRCVLFQIMSNHFNWPQVDSNQVVETSQGWTMETGCNWAQFWVS